MTSLKDRLATLPWVPAGPILRKVTAKSVTVWVALQETARITLSVRDDTNTVVATGTRSSTVAVGANLHIAAVTAHPTGADLKGGIVYHYDLNFAGAHKVADLGGAANSAKLSYGTATLPGFSLPPADISAVRLFHSSCRMPHGSGADALALLDVLIEQAAANAPAREYARARLACLAASDGPRRSRSTTGETCDLQPYGRYQASIHA
jgi:hypothetical protein